MLEVGIRTYKVEAADFPIAVEVAASKLPICRAVPSDVQVRKDGQVVRAFSVEVVPNPAANAIEYDLPKPPEGPGVDLVQVVHCWFGGNAPPDSYYEVALRPATPGCFRTIGLRPSIDPRKITLTFLFP